MQADTRVNPGALGDIASGAFVLREGDAIQGACVAGGDYLYLEPPFK